MGAITALLLLAVTCAGAVGVTYTGCVTVRAVEGAQPSHAFQLHVSCTTCDGERSLPERVVVDKPHMLYKSKFDPQTCATGTFDDQLHSVGWSFLNIETNSSCSNLEQAYSAGYLEGSLSFQRIYEFTFNEQDNATLPEKVS